MKTLILVTGQHRSGTSATAGCLQRLGVSLGGHLMPPAHDNPKGFFEDVRVVEIHDRLLEAHGASWDRPQNIVEGSWEGGATVEAETQLRIIVQEFAAASDLFAIKDPRAALVLPLWQHVAERESVRLVVLTPQRLQRAVARSLIARGGWAEERAWEVVHGYAKALSWLCGHPEIPWASVTFPDGLWQASTWENLARELDVELDVRDGIGKVHDFLDYGLVHHG
jgi:hypothetical protein